MSPRLGLLYGLALVLPGAAVAQVRASEMASVSQTVDGTKLTVSYSRPRARTRDSLFGKVVTWGEVWTPGANLATTFEVSKNVKLDGHPVPKGKYSVWMVVRPKGDWTFVLDPRADLFHMQHPDSTAEQIRFPVRTVEQPFSEVLSWSFPDVGISGATLVMQWGFVSVPVRIEVEPTYGLGFPRSEAGPYLGTYDYRWNEAPATAKPEGFIVWYENGSLLARWDPIPYPEWSKFALIRLKDGSFIPGFMDAKNQIFDVEKGMVFEFKLENGRAVSIAVRGEDDKVMATAVRRQ